MLIQYENLVPLIDVLEALSDLYYKTNRLEQAYIYLEEAKEYLDKIESGEHLLEIYRKLTNLSFQLNEVNNAKNYSTLFMNLQDSINKENIKEKVYEIEFNYQLKEKEDQIHLLEQAKIISDKKQQILLLTTFLIIVLLVSVLVILRLKNNTLKKNIIISDLQTQQKNKELQHSALLLSKRNKDLSEFMKQLDGLKKDLTLKGVNALKRQIKTTIQVENNWQEYIDTFNKLHPQFYQNLKNKGIELTNSEKRLSALIVQGLSINEIANVINIAPKSVEMARIRLRKKLEISKEEDLKSYLVKVGNQ